MWKRGPTGVCRASVIGARRSPFLLHELQRNLLDATVDKKLADLVRAEGTDACTARRKSNFERTNAHCQKCKGTSFRKETDILDVWFDSGVSWHSVVEQEFSNPKPKTVMVLEGSDQHRGWFQTSLIPSVALRVRPLTTLC